MRVVDRKRCLAQVGKVVLCGEAQGRNIFDRLDQRNLAFGYLAHRADHFRVPGVADEQDMLALFDLPFCLPVDLAHQGAGRIDIEKLAPLGFCGNGLGHAVCGKDHRDIIGHFVQFLDEYRPLRLQRVHDIAIVHDLVPDIDRCAILLERAFHDLDGAVHTGAKTAWRRDQQLQRKARIVGVRIFIRGLKGSVHIGPPSALHRAKLGDATSKVALHRALHTNTSGMLLS